MGRIDSFANQMVVKDIVQQIGLPAASDAGNDFYKAVALSHYQLIQVSVPFDFHPLPTSDF